MPGVGPQHSCSALGTACYRVARHDVLRCMHRCLQGGTAGPLQDGALPALPTSSTAHDMIPMDALGEPYQRLARNNKAGVHALNLFV